MCADCGCDGAWEMNPGHEHAHDHAHPHAHPHVHAHPHDHAHGHGHGHEPARSGARTVQLERDLLAKNDALAQKNRAALERGAVLSLNLIGAPGAGKTSLLEATISRLGDAHSLAVVEGDQATRRDAERIERAGCKVVQINTGTGCHLDASMLARALPELGLPRGSLLFIENVGNLVCPALFDLGEAKRVVVMSVTEGEDKPLKYPHVFRGAQLFVLTKIDLLPHLDFDADECVRLARSVNPQLREIRVSARTGQGLDSWLGWLRGHAAAQAALVGQS